MSTADFAVRLRMKSALPCAGPCRHTTDRSLVSMSTADFAARLRNRQPVLGYWSVIDSPVSTEWLAHIGWDYIALDLQHGLIGYDGMLRGLTAIDSAHGPAGIIRVEANDMTPIGRALDAGAAGVIVPPIDTAK